MSRPFPITFLSILLLFQAAAVAQNDSATISGRVTDQTGEEISDVTVAVTNIQTGVAVSTLTNADGIYFLGDLHPGPYQMTVEKQGFRRIVLKDLILNVQDALGRNFTMQLGIVSESITIKAGGEENLSSSVGTIVDQQFVENMPLNGRSFQSLILLTPGILATPAFQFAQGQFSVDGQRSNTNYFTVDGVSANFSSTASLDLAHSFGGSLPALTISGGTNSFVSIDGMQEFRIQTSTYSPELGRSPGAQIAIVTKSGTNLFHGTAYDYLRNDLFDARNYFNQAPQPKPALRQNDFGATVGGPIVKNHTFFFFSYEGLRLRQPETASGYFYTKDTRAAVAPVYQPLVNALPVPNGPLQDPTCDNIIKPCLASLTGSDSSPSNLDAYSLRLDHNLKQRITLFARYSHAPSKGKLAPASSFSMAQYDSLNTDTLTAGATITLSPTKLNDIRANWSRSFGNIYMTQDSSYGALPPPPSAIYRPGDSFSHNLDSISFPGGSQFVAMGTNVANVQRQLNFVDTFSMATGTHQLKFGADDRRLKPTNQGTSGYGLVLTDFSQLTAGTMGYVRVTASDPITAKLDNWSFFAQDTWKVQSRLTLTYGLRWEINTAPVSATPGKPLYAVEGIFDSNALQLAPASTPIWHTRYDNIAPRLGAAYQIGSRTVLRGGFGLFHDLGYSGELGWLLFGFPYRRSTFQSLTGQSFSLDSPTLQSPPFSFSLPTGQWGIVAFDPHLQLPRTWHWNAAVERGLWMNQSISLTYLGAHGQRLLRPDVIAPSGFAPKTSVVTTRNAGSSDYDAMQVQFQRRMTRGLQVLASYSLAKSRDTESDDVGGNFIVVGNGNVAPTVSQLRLPNLARSDFDIRHSFSAAASYEIPAPSLGKVAHKVLKDWTVDGIVRASSPPPVNVRIEGISPVLGSYFTQPDTVADQVFWLPAPGQPGGKILNPDAFTLPAEGAMGDFPRNSLESPFGVTQTDLAIRRRVHLNERVTLEVRAEYFNLFNHPMFGGAGAPSEFWGLCRSRPCTGQQSPNFGKVSSGVFPGTLNQGLGGGLQYGGQNPLYAQGGPRSAQFTLKLQF